MTSTVLIRDINGNTLGSLEVEGTPDPIEDESLGGYAAGDVTPFTNGEGWAVTLYMKEDV